MVYKKLQSDKLARETAYLDDKDIVKQGKVGHWRMLQHHLKEDAQHR